MPADAIDWAAAVRAGHRVAPTGPAVGPAEAAAVVRDLREFSARAELAVRVTTRLGAELPVQDAEVVDRRGWITATAQGMELLTEPLSAKMSAALAKAGGKGGRRAPSAAGSQIGAVLGFLSGKVLGQYDPLGGDPDDPGRLLLVAPNIVKVERELEVDPTDFRLWVCLHESTHRLQFTAVPWLRDHFRAQVAAFADATETDLPDLLKRILEGVTARRRSSADPRSWVETIQTPAQRAVFDDLMGLMSLLEGHADFVMDAVGPDVVPSVEKIRAAFTVRRRKGQGPFDRILRSLLGMDMKTAQYVRGAAFVGAVVDRVGMDGFNTVWTSPQTLPTRAEITDPDAWVTRVLG
ncbi:zinc-dependent metalloprotease [Nakamurella flavida]|uniref:Zinc-dependent metalloprotease n=1 Tax=Nakamurella flavida TaxID=363630 RepID=A0A938YMP5_9ACTN|nr:zinc-dependent metalloprotease [Nakamurella flavida]MBM9475720.1 zinc-dependent metalloprotease [Nakamurella flavida]MDP9778002.1 coenzyme F420 biosynthesis associated uncharacterized protein [Nakamurella flavida]